MTLVALPQKDKISGKGQNSSGVKEMTGASYFLFWPEGRRTRPGMRLFQPRFRRKEKLRGGFSTSELLCFLLVTFPVSALTNLFHN
jgi:hypothetical protein